LEGISSVMIDDRVVLVALAAFCTISAAGAMVDGVGCVGSCVAEREKWAALVQLNVDHWNSRKLN
jgi:hypothetical protein